LVTTLKGLVIDHDNVAKDAKSASKELYMWGQTESDDLKDVTDRLAYFQFVQGSLATTLAEKLDAARLPLKNLRDKEVDVSTRRNKRSVYEQQIAKLEMSSGNERKINELEQLLQRAIIEDEPLEKEVRILERKAIKENEHAMWEAIREYGEKLSILAQASEQVLQVLPSLPPSPARMYDGAQDTASIRAAAQKALDDWKPGQASFPVRHNAVDLTRSDTKSFGETHADELSYIGHDDSPVRPSTPNNPSGPSHPPVPVLAKTQDISPKQVASPPVLSLNNSPTDLPAPTIASPNTTAVPHTSSSDPNDPLVKFPQPTVAETGVPKSAGPDGPGPASGSLLEVKADHDAHGGTPGNTSGIASKPHESAEDEKKPLEREERERLPSRGSSTTTPKLETAEEEKKRLEREERERLFATGDNTGTSGEPDGGDELPPYKEF